MDITHCLSETVARGGSDLHLSAWAPPCARVNGTLHALDPAPLDPLVVRDMVLDTLTETQRATLEQELELDYALQVDAVGRFRGNVHIVRGQVEAAFRFVPQQVPELEQLGHHQVVSHFCNLRSGLVLVTGITGSGKSTTLASMVKRISETRSGVIVMLEDPINSSRSSA